MIQTSLFKRGPGLAFGVALFAFAPSATAAPAANQPGWSATTLDLTTGVVGGYESAFDPIGRKLYLADSTPTTVERQFKWTSGTPAVLSTTEYTDTIVQAAAGKVVSIDANTYGLSKTWSHVGLKDNNGNPSSGIIPGTPPTWAFTFGNLNASTGIQSGNNRQITPMPYGVAVDGNLADPTIVTANTRTASVTVYKASQSNPTDADVIKYANVGPGYAVQARTPVVDPERHKAYVAGYNGGAGVVFQINTITKAVEAVIPAPGAVGLALDVKGNRLFVGTFSAAATAESPKGQFLRILDLNKVSTASLDKAANTSVEVATVPNVGENTRPGYDPKTQKVYLAASVALPNANNSVPELTIVDANPSSANYATVVKRVELPNRPNTVVVDSERRLVYVPLLTPKVLAVIDADTDEFVQGVPTTGQAIDAEVDPQTGTVFVASQGNTGSPQGVGQVQAIKVTRPAALPKGDTGPAGPVGPAGTPGKDGLNSLALEISSLKLLGSKLSFTAPSAGQLLVTVKAGKRTIATGKRTATKAGDYSLTLTKTKYGKAQLKKKKSLKGTLTATFTPGAGTSAKKTQASIKATIKR